jgi:hypothetical protein
VTVFDGAKTKAPNGIGITLSEDALLPTGANVFQLAYAPITSDRGETDLEFWSNYNFGANDFLEVSIIHYNGQVSAITRPVCPGKARSRLWVAHHTKT